MRAGLKSHLIPVTEAARLLGVSPKVVRNLPGLNRVKIGRRLFVIKEDFLRLFGPVFEKCGTDLEEILSRD